MPPPPTSPPVRWGLAGWTLVLAAFAVGFASFPLRVAGPGFDHLPGDLVDGRFNNYVLEHGYRFLAGKERSFWDAPIFYPARGLTGYSDNHLGTLPLYAGLRAAGLSAERAFQGWFLLPFGLNFAAWTWAARQLRIGPVGAAAGGYVWAFGLPLSVLIAQHAQLGPRFLVPFALVLGWRWVWEPTTRRLGVIAVCVGGQTLLSPYVGYLLAVVLTVQTAVAAAWFRRELPWDALLRCGRPEWLRRGGVVAAGGLLALPAVLPPLLTAGGRTPIDPQAVRGLFPGPAAWLTAPHVSECRSWTGTIFPASAGTYGASEKQLFLGLAPLFAVGVALRKRTGYVAVGAATTLATMALVTRVGGVSLYDPLLAVPGVAGIRAVGRVVLVLAFPAGVATAAVADGLTTAAGNRHGIQGILAGTAALAAVWWDQRLVPLGGPRGGDWDAVRSSLVEAVVRRDRVSAALAKHPNAGVVYAFPDPDFGVTGWLTLQMDVARGCQDAGIPTVNGYTGHFPLWWGPLLTVGGVEWWLYDLHGLPRLPHGTLVFLGDPPGDREDVAWRLPAPAGRFSPPLPRPPVERRARPFGW